MRHRVDILYASCKDDMGDPLEDALMCTVGNHSALCCTRCADVDMLILAGNSRSGHLQEEGMMGQSKRKG